LLSEVTAECIGKKQNSKVKKKKTGRNGFFLGACCRSRRFQQQVMINVNLRKNWITYGFGRGDCDYRVYGSAITQTEEPKKDGYEQTTKGTQKADKRASGNCDVGAYGSRGRKYFRR
jgi:hypothetical protein